MQFGDYLLATAKLSSSVVRETLRRYEDRPLGDFLGSISGPTLPALQSRDDLWGAVELETRTYYGAETATEVAAALRSEPLVPTSNHFGIDTMAESAQSTLLFSLRRGQGARAKHVVVFGFGSISMNNWSYPMGLRLYDLEHRQLGELPSRLPIFPNRMKQCAVCAVGPFDEHMVKRARDRLRRMAQAGEMTPFGARAAGEVLDEVLDVPSTLSLPTYSAQSAAVNGMLWRRMFSDRTLGGELVQLQVERICAALLRRDLYDPSSLVHRLFFLGDVREQLLVALDGARACWRGAELQRGLPEGTPGGARREGTVFFWGLSNSGRRIALTLEERRSEVALVGVDDRGEEWRAEFSPDGILGGLETGRLLPSLFTCFAVLAFARGLCCVGGYYQAEYLPVMQAGVVHALAATGHRHAADLVAQVPTRICLGALQGLVRELDDGAVIPAGPVELAGMGGLDESALAEFLGISVREAYLLAFTELFQHLVAGVDLPDDWVRRLALENGQRRRQRRIGASARRATVSSMVAELSK